jgi:TolA-binding protein
MVASAIVATGGFVATAAVAQQVSKESAKTLKAAQDAAAAKNYPGEIAAAQEALANPKKSKDDTYVAYSMLSHAYYATGNMPELLKSLQGQIDSGFPGADVNKITQTQTQVAFQAKLYDQAVQYGQRLITAGAASPEVYTTVGQSYFQQQKYNDAAKFFSGLVSNAEKAGRKPDDQHLKLLLTSYDKAGNKTASNEALEKLVKYYPTANTWNALLFPLKTEKQEPRQKLHVFRLMQDTGNLKQAPDYSSYSEVATAVGLPAEAYNVLEAAIKANAFTQDTEKQRAERYLASARTRTDSAKAEMPKREVEAKAAATGDLDVSYGMALFSFGDYPKAIEAIKRGIGKGSLRNTADAQLTLGIAQLRSSQKSEALATFKSIESTDAVTTRIAELWELYASGSTASVAQR